MFRHWTNQLNQLNRKLAYIINQWTCFTTFRFPVQVHVSLSILHTAFLLLSTTAYIIKLTSPSFKSICCSRWYILDAPPRFSLKSPDLFRRILSKGEIRIKIGCKGEEKHNFDGFEIEIPWNYEDWLVKSTWTPPAN